MPDNFHPEIYLFADFKLDVSTERLLFEGREIPLTPKAFTLLTYFARNPNRLITYKELVDVGWPTDDPELREQNKSKYTQQVVDLIRDALNDRHPYRIITNKTKRGYVFEAKVTTFHDGPEPDVSLQSEPLGLVIGSQEGKGQGTSPESVSLETTSNSPYIPDHDNQPSNVTHVVSKVANDSSGVTERSQTEFVIGETEGFFEHWMFGSSLNLTILIGCLVFATLIAAAAISGKSPSKASALVCTISVVLLALALRHSAKHKPRTQREEPKLEELVAAGYRDLNDYRGVRDALQTSLERFATRWRLLLFSWILLYCSFAVEFWISTDGANQLVPRWKVVVHMIELMLNLVNTFMIALCYEVLNKDLAPRRRRRTLNRTSLLGLGVLFVTVAVAIEVSLKPEQVELFRSQLQTGVALLTGILAGIIMALFVARLQSKHLDPPAWAIFLLFSYTAIQPLVLYIQNQRPLTWALLWYALFLKSLLYLYVFWLLQSGDLLFYFAQSKRTYEHVDDRRRAHRRLVQ